MSKIKVFKIKGEFITLGQFLKEETYVGSGGQAKFFLAETPVILNGQKENRRGKKLYVGDEVEVQGQIYKFE